MSHGVIQTIVFTISMAFYMTILEDRTTDDQYKLASYILIAKGFGGMLGGPLNGLIYKKNNLRVVSINTLIVHIISFSTLVLCGIVDTYPWLCYTSAFFLGLQDSSLIS